jgi:hypothetical protein
MNTEKVMKRLLIAALIIIAIALFGDVFQAFVELVFDSGI